MSRIGKKPIPLTKDVKVHMDGDILKVKGPKGELERWIHPGVRVNVDGDQVTVSVSEETREAKSFHGLFRILVANMVTGVTNGFERVLEIVGVGYRAEVKDRTAVLHLGYSHPVKFDLPEGIEAKVDKSRVVLTGIDKELLGRVAAKIRNFRAPDSYKGKGIRYANEVVRKKAGKAGSK